MIDGKALVTESHLEDIGDALQYRLNTSERFYPRQMADAIMRIPFGKFTNTNEIKDSVIQFTFEITSEYDTQGGCAFSLVDDYTFDASGLYFATVIGKKTDLEKRILIHDHVGEQVSYVTLPEGHWGNVFFKNGHLYAYNSIQNNSLRKTTTGDGKLYSVDVSDPANPVLAEVSGVATDYTGVCNYVGTTILLYRKGQDGAFRFWAHDLTTGQTESDPKLTIAVEGPPLFGGMAHFFYDSTNDMLLRNGTRPNCAVAYSAKTGEKLGVFKINDFNGYSDVGELESFELHGPICYYHSIYTGQNVLALTKQNSSSESDSDSDEAIVPDEDDIDIDDESPDDEELGNLLPPSVVQWFYTDTRGIASTRKTWTDGHIVVLDYQGEELAHGRNYFITGPVRIFCKYAFQALACLRHMRSDFTLNILSPYPYMIVLYGISGVTITSQKSKQPVTGSIGGLVLVKCGTLTLSMKKECFRTGDAYGFGSGSDVYELYATQCGSLVFTEQFKGFAEGTFEDGHMFACFRRVNMVNALSMHYARLYHSVMRAQEIMHCKLTNSSLGFTASTKDVDNTVDNASSAFIVHVNS